MPCARKTRGWFGILSLEFNFESISSAADNFEEATFYTCRANELEIIAITHDPVQCHEVVVARVDFAGGGGNMWLTQCFTTYCKELVYDKREEGEDPMVPYELFPSHDLQLVPNDLSSTLFPNGNELVRIPGIPNAVEFLVFNLEFGNVFVLVSRNDLVCVFMIGKHKYKRSVYTSVSEPM